MAPRLLSPDRAWFWFWAWKTVQAYRYWSLGCIDATRFRCTLED